MKNRGFSMIELVMTVLIIGVVLVCAMPAAVKYKATMRTVQAREMLIRDIRTARQRAVTGRYPVIIQFGNGLGTTSVTTYNILRDANGDRAATSGELKISRTLPTGTTMSKVSLAPVDSLTFDVSGIL
ncbi:MAG TPA: GspH/FimT family pseudopilin, partial [Dongiaceae bacterium]|nr:GspH/FimT family pseudopilin [Dongiaceae bacterium]